MESGTHRPGPPVIAREEYPGGRVFEVVTGDLLSERVDAIVNAANGHLAHGGGVAAAIARAAGFALVEEGDRIVSRLGPVDVGDAVVTTAGRLPFQGVIHAVKVARHLDDNYAMDEFHDRLMAEELHDALVKKGLIKEL